MSHLVNGATGLQWGHTFSGMGSVANPYFTGVTILLQWGHTFSGMGRGTQRIHPATLRSFNGATPFQAWEEPRERHHHHRRFRASMGPHLFRYGKNGQQVWVCSPHCRFNGATPFQVWEVGRFDQERNMEPASMGPHLFRYGKACLPRSDPEECPLWGDSHAESWSGYGHIFDCERAYPAHTGNFASGP